MSTSSNELKILHTSLPEQPQLQPSDGYHITWQGKGINNLTGVTLRKVEAAATAQQIELFPKDEGYLKPVKVVVGDVEYTLSNNACVISGRTIQVIRYITTRYTEKALQAYTPEEKEAARYVELSIKEVGKKFNMADYTAIKTMLTTEINTLAEIWAEWYEYVYYHDDQTNKRKKSLDIEHYQTRLIGFIKETIPAGQEGKSKAQMFKRGKVTVRIDEDFAKYLQNSFVMAISDKFYTIVPKKNPYSVALYDKIMTHYRSNITKSNRTTIKVKTLLERTGIPSYKDIAKKGRINQLIFEPFERDMDNLQELGLIKSWHYCKPNGVELKLEEKQKMTGQQFESYDIHFELPEEYPAMRPLQLAEGVPDQ